MSARDTVLSDCQVSTGWERRIATKTATAGVLGIAAGSVLAMLRQARLGQYSLGVGASVAFCMGCYSAMQEGVRRLRCTDDVLNSAFAGGFTASTLVGFHQGDRRKALAAGLWGAAAAGFCHAAHDYLGMSSWVRQMLQEDHQGLGSDRQQQKQRQPVPAEDFVPPWWERYLPIRRMSEEEWQDYQHRRTEGFKQRVQATVQGGLPAALEKQRQQRDQQPEDRISEPTL